MASMIFSAILYRNGKKFNGQVVIMKGLFEDPEKKCALFKIDDSKSYVVHPEPGKPYRGTVWLFKENDNLANKNT